MPFLLLPLLSLLLQSAVLPAHAQVAPDPEVQRLVGEQKFQAALDRVRARIDEKRKSANAMEWASLVAQEAQLQIALHGYETAVRDLQARRWPGQPVAHAMLALVQARALQTYSQSYSWEIRGREKTESKAKKELKTMTADEIYLEASRALAGAWKEREALGRQPKNALGEIVQPNSYPEGIRDTLRDSLTYLYVELLADTAGWTPAQSNEAYTLSAARLVQDSKLGEAALTDPRAHPLDKIAYLLHDLRRWNEGRGKPGAALEARFELIQRLHQSLTDNSSRQALEAELKRLTESQKKQPWVTMGYGLLAQFRLEQDDAEAKVRARAIAKAGAELHPTSPGAARCRDLVRDIEQPQFQLEAMRVDGPGKRSIGVRYRNLRKIHFRSYSFDLLTFLRNSKDYSLRPDAREIEQLRGRKPDQEWSVELPETVDYRDHEAYSVPPAHRPGFYLVLASAKSDFTPQANQLQGVQMQFSDLVLTHHHGLHEGALEAEVRSGATGDALGGVQVSLYQTDYQKGHQLVYRTITTGADGVARFPLGVREASRRGGSYFLIAQKGADSTASENPFSVAAREPRDRIQHSFVYTDRAIYRPGQKVLWKILAYGGDADQAKFTAAKNEELTVELRDANSQVVTTAKARTNAFGTASGEFVIPAGRILGAWTVRTSRTGSAGIRVEEYKRPTFEIKFADQAAPMRLNREARVEGSATYYFGLPVPAGSVRFNVRRTAVLPWWCFGWGFGILRGADATQAQVVATGSAKLGADGRFAVAFTPKADEKLASAIEDLTYRYEVSVDVTDEGGETRSQSRAYTVGFSAVRAQLELSQKFYRDGETPVVRVRRTDLNGSPLAGKGEWRLARLQGPAAALPPAEQPLPPELKKAAAGGFSTPGDLQLPRWNPGYRPELILRGWAEAESVGKGGVDVAAPAGEGSVTLPKLAPGAYRLVYSTRDSFGTAYDTQAEFVVQSAAVGAVASIPLPGLFVLDRATAKVGEKLRLLVMSGFNGQQMVLETYRSGLLIKKQRLVAGRDSPLLELPITEADRGGLAFTLRMVRDHQSIVFTDRVHVPWDNRELKLSWSTFRDRIRPGGKETWTLTLQGPDARALSAGTAEVLASMYDRSLDFFAPHAPPTPLAIYPERAEGQQPEIELGPAPQIYVQSSGFSHRYEYTAFQPDQVGFYPNYGVGGPGARGGFGAYGGRLAKGAVMAQLSESVPQAPSEVAAKMEGASMDLVAEKRSKVPERAEPAANAPAPELRSNFNETAFWMPHLLTGKDGTVRIEFEVPDSVTSWKVWAMAVTQDLRSGQVERETRSVKELMVRPALPRFLREGDRAELAIVVNNASERELAGNVELDLVDPDTKKSRLAEFKPVMKGDGAFRIGAGRSQTYTVQVTAPAQVGTIAIRATASAKGPSGSFSDGELRPIPVLPGRFHLAQSRFVTLKGANARREMKFDDLARADDPSRIQEQLVVTLDAQLFYSVLSALPYLVESPYDCVDQRLNAFVSTGILTSTFKRFPAIEKMARELSSRKTPLEAWDAPDPNRKMALEEMPWLVEARGGDSENKSVLRVLDSRVARSVQSDSLRQLEKAQTSIGGFPWFAGGPPSPWMTLYVLYGMSKALEFGVEVPRDLVQKGWAYLHQHYVDELVREMMTGKHLVEFVTFINYTLSNYPDDSWTGGVFTAEDRRKMLEHGFRYWREHSPYLKGYLALTLQRAKRPADAKLVWDSVMDSARTTEDEGTHWAAEDRSWLWYNDTVASHAFALRTGSELGTPPPQLDGLVQWLFLNKKLNHWKSTRATAEVIYSLAHYLQKTGQLGQPEKARVRAGGETREFAFDPARYTGRKNQWVIPAAKVGPAVQPIAVEKSGPGMMFASTTWHYSTEKLPAEARGDFLSVTRSYFRRTITSGGAKLEPLGEGARVRVGDEVEVQLSLRAKHEAEYVHLMDPRAAGFEPTDTTSRHQWDLGLYWYETVRDSGTSFFFERLPAGEYRFRYRIRATTAGVFKAGPATLQPMYAPEFNAFSAGDTLRIEAAK